MKELEALKEKAIPQHIAIIMDGNGRWAKKKGAKRIFGHQNAIKAVREATEGCAELGCEVLTLYAFSTENWNRPKEEVNALMDLLVRTITAELKTLQENKIRLVTIGDTAGLPDKCRQNLLKAMEATKANTHMKLNLALNYSGRWDIRQAAAAIARDAQEGKIKGELDNDSFAQYLSTAGLPDPELLIRTSGEQRISNFLLWECAYTEFYFSEVLWPDFRKKHLSEAITNFQSRERRFGKTTEQLLELKGSKLS